MGAIDIAVVVTILAAAVRIATPLIFVSLGEIITEKSGVLNLGVEGIMLMGAISGFYAAYTFDDLWLGMLAGVLVGMFFGAFHAYFCVFLRTDQTITGISLWILGLGLSSFIYRIAFSGYFVRPRVSTFPLISIPILNDIPWFGPIFFNHNILVYLGFITVPIVWWLINKTEFGLKVQAVGEHPKAADTFGINVLKIRFISVVIGGAFAGAAGAFIPIGSLGSFVDNMTQGRGFIAIAIVIFSRWNPLFAVLGALLFGTMSAMGTRFQVMGIDIAHQALLALPYIATIFALVMFNLSRKGKRGGAPGSLAVPYEKE